MKSVLIPTDFSPESRRTLEHVLDYLKDAEAGSRILLVNTYLVQLNTDPLELISLNDELKKKSKEMLENEVRWAQAHCQNPHLSIEYASHMGSLNNVILNIVRREKINLVAMGKGEEVVFQKV